VEIPNYASNHLVLTAMIKDACKC